MAFFSLFVSSCVSTIDDLPFPAHGSSHEVKNEQVEIGFSGDGGPPVLKQALSDLEADNDITKAVDEACTLAPTAAAVPGAVAVLAPLVLNWAASQATQAINNYESSFEATWSGRAVEQFYTMGSMGAKGLPPPRHRCMYVIRRAGTGKAPLFLYVAELRTSDDERALRLVPRLISYNGAKARTGSGGRFNAVMTLTIEAIWSDGRKGVETSRGTVLTAVTDFGQRVLPGAPAKLVLLSDGEQSRQASSWLPSIPVSIGPDGRANGSGPFTATVTMAETATVKDLVGSAAAAAREGVNRGVVLIREELGLPDASSADSSR